MEVVRVVRARDRVAVLGVLRVVLGAVAVVVALGLTTVTRQQLALGLVLGILGLGVVGTLRQLELHGGEVELALPPRAVTVGPLGAALQGLLPSSVGVFVLALGAALLEPLLTPLLAGMLIGMGLVTFASLVQITSNERLHRWRLFASVDPPPRAFAVPRAGHGSDG